MHFNINVGGVAAGETFGDGIDRTRLGGGSAWLPVTLGETTPRELEAELVELPRQGRYEHLFRYISSTPWAILPETLAVITDLMTYRMAGFRLSNEELGERIGHEPGEPIQGVVEDGMLLIEPEARRGGSTKTSGRGGAVALLSLYGVIAPRASMVENISGPSGTGLDSFSSLLAQAVNDDEVGSIVIDVNSPGGTIDMVPETGEKIRQARAQKPIYAVANTQAASAAYWLASQATEVIATPSGDVGSIGVYAAHQDISGELEQRGRKVTMISAGKYKTETAPFAALSEEARAYVQAGVDEAYGWFIDAVAKGRGVKSSVVREDFGEGRMLSAKKALSAGMIDRVATLEETVTRALRGGGDRRGAASSFAGVTFPDNEGVTLEDVSNLQY